MQYTKNYHPYKITLLLNQDVLSRLIDLRLFVQIGERVIKMKHHVNVNPYTLDQVFNMLADSFLNPQGEDINDLKNHDNLRFFISRFLAETRAVVNANLKHGGF